MIEEFEDKKGEAYFKCEDCDSCGRDIFRGKYYYKWISIYDDEASPSAGGTEYILCERCAKRRKSE
jgi:uncharacterized C2H2 Zn-finger protein